MFYLRLEGVIYKPSRNPMSYHIFDNASTQGQKLKAMLLAMLGLVSYLAWLFVPPNVKIVVQPVVVYPGHHIVDDGFHRAMHLGCIARFHCLVEKVPFIYFPVQSWKQVNTVFKTMDYVLF